MNQRCPLTWRANGRQPLKLKGETGSAVAPIPVR